jgi:PAS domain-containing protein
MPSHSNTLKNQAGLRLRAVARLTGHGSAESASASASAALGILHGMASTPDRSSDALALLHELQVHQVELDMQADDLRQSRAELELALARQIQLYDFSPVACFSVDGQTTIHELNLPGAQLLGVDRDDLYGQALDTFMSFRSASALHALLMSAREGRCRACCELELKGPEGAVQVLHASARPDPVGHGFLLALL